MADIYTLHFDGSCGPKNPGGTAAYGYHLAKNSIPIESGHGVIGDGPAMSNNVAEYVALYRGIRAFVAATGDGIAHLQVRGDSMLVINQMNHDWKAKSGLYFPYYDMTADLVAELELLGATFDFQWIPREANTICDDLSKAHLGVSK